MVAMINTQIAAEKKGGRRSGNPGAQASPERESGGAEGAGRGSR